MNKQKQTAVEWLFHKLWDEPKDKFTWYSLLKKAKEMEREQIEDAFQDGKWDWDEHILKGKESKDLAIYYNETYGKEKNSTESTRK